MIGHALQKPVKSTAAAEELHAEEVREGGKGYGRIGEEILMGRSAVDIRVIAVVYDMRGEGTVGKL